MKIYGKIFVSNNYVKNSPFTFALSIDDHNINTMLVNSCKNYYCWKTFIQNYKLGNVRFENMSIKASTQNMIKHFITK